MKKILKNNKGFTLIELIVVLVVLTILMCLTAPSVFGYSRKAQEAAAIEECKGVVSAVIDIFSDQYVNKGTRITGDECLIGKGDDPEGRDDPTIVEAKRLAGVDGDVRGAWVRGNEEYILSHLVYEWSSNLWVVYDEGEYKVYKGMTDTPDKYKEKGTKPAEKPVDPPTKDPDEDDWDEETTVNTAMPEEKPTEATTEAATQAPATQEEPTSEAATEVVEEPSETITMKDTDGNVHVFGEGRWEEVKYNSQPADDTTPDQNHSRGTANVTVGLIYKDASGTYVCISTEWLGTNIPMEWTIADYMKEHPDKAWCLIEIDENTPIWLEKDYEQDAIAQGGWGKSAYPKNWTGWAEPDPANQINLKYGDIKYVNGEYLIWPDKYNSGPLSTYWDWTNWKKFSD